MAMQPFLHRLSPCTGSLYSPCKLPGLWRGSNYFINVLKSKPGSRLSWSLPASGAAQVRAPRSPAFGWSFSAVRGLKDEQAAARQAAVNADSESPTIFDKIVSREIAASIVYEDDKVLAFHDVNPQAPVHVILIPKKRDGLTRLAKANESHKYILGHLLYVSKIVADQEGLADGYRIVINDGPNGSQSVYHLHLHIIGGRQMKWPPG